MHGWVCIIYRRFLCLSLPLLKFCASQTYAGLLGATMFNIATVCKQRSRVWTKAYAGALKFVPIYHGCVCTRCWFDQLLSALSTSGVLRNKLPPYTPPNGCYFTLFVVAGGGRLVCSPPCLTRRPARSWRATTWRGCWCSNGLGPL